MLVDLNQYRGTVGMFYNCKNIYCNTGNIYYNKALRIYSSFIFFGVIFICVAYLFSLTVRLMRSSSILLRAKFRISYTYVNTIFFSITLIYVNHFWLYNIFIKLCDDVEENPGPKPSSKQIFSIYHWNLNSISAHNYIKLSLLRVYLSTHKFDVICISETYRDTSHEEANLEIVGYTLIRADHPSNTKRGSTCLYYRHSLTSRLLNIQHLEECINFEILFAGKVCNFISLYQSPSQSHDVFETFADNLELNLDTIANKNPYIYR